MIEAFRDNAFATMFIRNDGWCILLFEVDMHRLIIGTGMCRHTDIGDIESFKKLGREDERQKLME